MQYAEKFTVLENPVYCQSYVSYVKFGTFVFRMRLQFWEHSPSQSHSGVHSRPAFLHLHFFTQPSLHLQETSSLQILDASGSVVQRGSYTPLVLIHPQSVGDGSVGAGTTVWPQRCPPWYTARRTCCYHWVAMIESLLLINRIYRSRMTLMSIAAP